MKFFGGFSFPVGKGRAGISRRGRPWAGIRGGKGPLYGGAITSVKLPAPGDGGELVRMDLGASRGTVTDIHRHIDHAGDLTTFTFVLDTGDELVVTLNREGRKRLEALL